TPALDDQLQDSLKAWFAADRIGDVARRLERAHGVLQLLPPPLAGLIQTRVVDCDGRPLRKHDHRPLVLSREFCSASFLGQIEIPPRGPPDYQRTPEEGLHPRVFGWEPVAVGVLTDIGEPQGPGVLDKDTEHAATMRQVPDRAICLGIDAT